MAIPPRARGTGPLFTIYHEFVDPNPEDENFLSHHDPIDEAHRAAYAAWHDKPSAYDKDTDLFFFDGLVWRMADTYYIARKVNTEHPDALQWLMDKGYDVEGAPMGWVWEFVLDNGRSLTTAHRYSLRSAPRLTFGKSQFVLLDTAIVNLNRVVHANSFYANLDLHVAHLQKTPH